MADQRAGLTVGDVTATERPVPDRWPRLRRWGAAIRRHPWSAKFAKYFTGSAAATVLGQLTFLAVFGSGLASARTTTFIAFAVAAVPNYFFHRHWAWRRRGRPDFFRELLPYLTLITLNLTIATWTTSLVEAQTAHLGSHLARTLLVTGTYGLTYGTLFIGKFLVFEYLLFGDRAYAKRYANARRRAAERRRDGGRSRQWRRSKRPEPEPESSVPDKKPQPAGSDDPLGS